MFLVWMKEQIQDYFPGIYGCCMHDIFVDVLRLIVRMSDSCHLHHLLTPHVTKTSMMNLESIYTGAFLLAAAIVLYVELGYLWIVSSPSLLTHNVEPTL